MSQAPATEIRNEIATTRDGRDITRPFVDPLMPLPVEDTVLLERGGGDYRLYNEVWRDDHVKSAVEQRRRAVIARPWEVRPGGKRAIDKAAADFLRENIDALGWDAVCDKMLAGVFHGFSVAEAMWTQDGRYWRLGELRVRNRRRFGFNHLDQLVLKTMARPLGEPMPDRKFWIFATGADHDDAPYGLGLAHWLYWPVWFKRNAHRFWAVFLEKFGTPAVKGTYPAGTPEAQQTELLDSLRDLRQDSAVVVPEGMAVELIEATRAGTADFAGFVEAMNKAILVAAIGQTASTQGTPGQLGAGETRDKVRLDIVKADADLLGASFNGSIARWLTEWNFPGAAVPGVWRIVEDSEDLKARSDRDKNIYTMGYKPTLKYVEETYGGEWEEAPATPNIAVATPNVAPAGSNASFADGDGQADPVALMAARMAMDTGRPVNDWLATLRTMLDKAGSLGEFRVMLDAAFAELPGDAVATAMAEGFLAAELAGIDEAKNGL